MHGEGDPAAEPVAHLPPVVLDGETCLDEQLRRRGARQPPQQEVRVARRVPDAERLDRRGVQPPLPEVRARVLALPAVEQHSVVQLERLLVDVVERLATRRGAAIGGGVALVPHGDARLLGQSLDRLGELEMLDLAEEADGVAAGAAPEAVVDALGRRDRERRRLLGVKGAQAAERVVPGLLERQVLRDDLDDVGALAHRLDVVLPDPSRHRTPPLGRATTTSLGEGTAARTS